MEGSRPALFALLIGALFGLTAARQQLVSSDPAVYIELAHSLVSGGGYSYDGVPHTYYPPGLPLALTPVIAVAGMNVTAAQVYVALWGAMSLLVVFAYLKRRGDSPAAGITMFLVLGSGFYATATTGVRSEPLYITAVFALLFALERRPSSSRKDIWLVCLAMLGAAIPAIRTVGVAVLAALAASVVQAAARARRRGDSLRFAAVDRLVAAAAGSLVFTLWWESWILRHGAAGSYNGDLVLKNAHIPDEGPATLADIVRRVAENAAAQLTHVGELASNLLPLPHLWSSPIVLLLCPIILAGWAQEFRRSMPIAGWYMLFYLGIIVVWPFDEGTRFLVPILPLLVLFAIRGAPSALTNLRRWLPPLSTLGIVVAGLEVHGADVGSRHRLAALGSLVFWAASLLVGTTLALRSRDWRTSLLKSWGIRLLTALGGAYVIIGVRAIGLLAWSNVTGTTRGPHEVIRAATSWIAANTGPDDRIMAQWTAGIHFYTRRRTLLLPVTGDPHQLCIAVASSQPDYLLITHAPAFPYYHPTEDERFAVLDRVLPGSFRVVFEYGMGRIYRVSALPSRGYCEGVKSGNVRNR